MKFTPRLRVITGRHAGATQVLDHGHFVLGSSLESDIVITDTSVLARHAQLTPGNYAIELEALEGDVAFDGQIIRAGSKVQGRYPLHFSLGGVEVEVTAIPLHARQPLAQMLTIGGFALLFLLVAAKLYSDVSGSRSSTNLGSGADQAAQASSGKDSAAVQGKLAEAASEALRQRLQSLNINTVSVKAGPGTVSVSGVIDTQQKDDWQASQVWFDENFGQHVVLQADVNVLAKQPAKAPIAIQAVWYGKFPYLIDGDGNKYFEGSKLKDGWVLEKIQEGKILLSKDKEPLLLRF